MKPTYVSYGRLLFIHQKCGVQVQQQVASRRTAPRLREGSEENNFIEHCPKHCSKQDMPRSCGSARFQAKL
jgi:hypothetical protein